MFPLSTRKKSQSSVAQTSTVHFIRVQYKFILIQSTLDMLVKFLLRLVSLFSSLQSSPVKVSSGQAILGQCNSSVQFSFKGTPADIVQ